MRRCLAFLRRRWRYAAAENSIGVFQLFCGIRRIYLGQQSARFFPDALFSVFSGSEYANVSVKAVRAGEQKLDIFLRLSDYKCFL